MIFCILKYQFLPADNQQNTAYELNALSAQWRELCLKNMEIQAACLNLENQIEELKKEAEERYQPLPLCVCVCEYIIFSCLCILAFELANVSPLQRLELGNFYGEWPFSLATTRYDICLFPFSFLFPYF